LRCLAVVLLAAGFARPFLSKSDAPPPAAGEGRQILVLLDTSASMRREGLWPMALSMAERSINEASLLDRLAVVTFDEQPHTLVSFTDWSSWPEDQRGALAKQRLAAVSPGWRGTHLGLALTTAAEQFSDAAGVSGASGPRDISLISDLQEGAKLDGLQGHDWPRGVRVVIQRIDPKRRGNAGLSIVEASRSSAATGREARVRVINAPDSSQERFLLGWKLESGSGFVGQPAEVYLPPGQTRTLPVPQLPGAGAAGALLLTGDEESFDKTAYFAASDLERVSVACFTSESASDPQHLRYYLERAFPDTARRQVRLVTTVSNSVFALDTLNQAALAVIPSNLEADEIKAVRAWLSGGKTALLVLTNAQFGPTLAGLAGVAGIDISEATGNYALLGEIDFTHPIFSPFADPRFSDFSRIHFWQHRRWTIPPSLPARTLAKFDDGSPALAQITVGKGNLLVLAAGWNPVESQLAVSSKFLPLMQTLLDWSGGAPPLRCQFQIGESIPSPVSSGAALQWRKPDGKLVSLAAGQSFTDTDLPGIYTVMAASGLRHLAVNLPFDESRTAPMSPDDLARLGVPLQAAAAFAVADTVNSQRRVMQAELESRQKLWRWLIVGLLAVALFETVLAGWLSRRVKTLEVVQ
jgi:hypothetical protein